MMTEGSASLCIFENLLTNEAADTVKELYWDMVLQGV